MSSVEHYFTGGRASCLIRLLPIGGLAGPAGPL